jgi:uroporphyrin-III C-methyltransferase
MARPNHTVAIYMGLTQAAMLSERLIAAGRDGATPALIVVEASRSNEQRVKTTLAQLAAAAEHLSGPALLIIGEAMALADVSGTDVQIETLLEAVR